ERMSARTFFETYVVPFATKHGIEAVMVRANNEEGKPLPALIDVLRGAKGDSFEKMIRGMGVPLYTHDRTNGQLKQSCTEKWKIRAIHQEARRRGIDLLRSAIGYHAMESRRIKAAWIETDGGFEVYKPLRRRDGKPVPIKWLEHYYPLIDLGM